MCNKKKNVTSYRDVYLWLEWNAVTHTIMCIYVCVCLYVYAHIYVCVCLYVYAHIYVCVCIVYVGVYVYITYVSV